jgi:cholesterol transport system auxiliary component
MQRFLAITVTVLIALFALPGCSVIHAEAPAQYDLGPLRSTASAPDALAGLPPVIVADVTLPAWLDNEAMFYRLNYANQQQPRAYVNSRWAMSPGRLLGQQVKLRIAQAGGVPLAPSDGATGVPILRMQIDDFSQHFTTPAASTGRIALRATVIQGRKVLAQRSFVKEVPAPSADAAGGAQALAEASDAALSDLVGWLATLGLQ